MKCSQKYLFLVLTSYGHIFPAIRAAHLLQKRGKEVLFVTAIEYQSLLEVHGIKCVAINNQPQAFFSTHTWFESEVGLKQYQIIDKVIQEFKPDVIAASPLMMPAFALGEVHDIPIVIIGYCEYLYPSLNDQNSNKQWRIESITGYYNQLRYKLNLPFVEADPNATPLNGQKLLLRSIPLFTKQEGLPKEVEYVGSMNWELPYVNYQLDYFVEQIKKKQQAIFYVQVGRLFENKMIWDALIKLLGQMPAGFVLDYSRADYISDNLNYPENIYLHSFIPLGYLKDHISGVICGGQTTVVVSSIFYGKPILGIPNSADGSEVTERIKHEGIGMGVDLPGDLDKLENVLLTFIESVQNSDFENDLAPLTEQFHEYDNEEYLYSKISFS